MTGVVKKEVDGKTLRSTPVSWVLEQCVLLQLLVDKFVGGEGPPGDLPGS